MVILRTVARMHTIIFLTGYRTWLHCAVSKTGNNSPLSAIRWAEWWQQHWLRPFLSWLNAWLANTATPEGPLRRAGLIGDLGFDAQWTLDLPLQASNTPAPAAPAQRPQTRPVSASVPNSATTCFS